MSRAQHLRRLDGYGEIATELEVLALDEACQLDPELLDQRLTTAEQKMIKLAYSRQTETDVLQVRREVKMQLDPHRKKMSTNQLQALERQFFGRRLLERTGLPRLSLFYASDTLEYAA